MKTLLTVPAPTLPSTATSAVVCDGTVMEICAMCEGVTTIRLLKAGWPRIKCPQCKGTGKIASRSHTGMDEGLRSSASETTTKPL